MNQMTRSSSCRKLLPLKSPITVFTFFKYNYTTYNIQCIQFLVCTCVSAFVVCHISLAGVYEASFRVQKNHDYIVKDSCSCCMTEDHSIVSCPGY